MCLNYLGPFKCGFFFYSSVLQTYFLFLMIVLIFSLISLTDCKNTVYMQHTKYVLIAYVIKKALVYSSY